MSMLNVMSRTVLWLQRLRMLGLFSVVKSSNYRKKLEHSWAGSTWQSWQSQHTLKQSSRKTNNVSSWQHLPHRTRTGFAVKKRTEYPWNSSSEEKSNARMKLWTTHKTQHHAPTCNIHQFHIVWISAQLLTLAYSLSLEVENCLCWTSSCDFAS